MYSWAKTEEGEIGIRVGNSALGEGQRIIWDISATPPSPSLSCFKEIDSPPQKPLLIECWALHTRKSTALILHRRIDYKWFHRKQESKQKICNGDTSYLLNITKALLSYSKLTFTTAQSLNQQRPCCERTETVPKCYIAAKFWSFNIFYHASHTIVSTKVKGAVTARL